MSFPGMSQVTDKIGNKVNQYFEWIDGIKTPWRRTAMLIITDLGLILLPLAVLIAMNGVSFHGPHFLIFGKPHFLSFGQITAKIFHPSGFSAFSTLAMVGMAGAAIGTGTMWLLEDTLGSKYANGAGKVMALVAPFLLIAGGGLLIYSGGAVHGAHGLGFSFTKSMGSGWAIAGILLIPGSLFVASKSVEVLQKGENIQVIKNSKASNQSCHRVQQSRQQKEFKKIKLDQQSKSTKRKELDQID